MKYLKMQDCRRSSRVAPNALCCNVLLGVLILIGFLEPSAKAGMPAASLAKISNASNAGSSSAIALSRPVWDGKTLLIHADRGTLSVTVVSDDIIRVHFTAANSSGRNDS